MPNAAQRAAGDASAVGMLSVAAQLLKYHYNGISNVYMRCAIAAQRSAAAAVQAFGIVAQLQPHAEGARAITPAMTRVRAASACADTRRAMRDVSAGTRAQWTR